MNKVGLQIDNDATATLNIPSVGIEDIELHPSLSSDLINVPLIIKKLGHLCLPSVLPSSGLPLTFASPGEGVQIETFHMLKYFKLLNQGSKLLNKLYFVLLP